MDDRVAGRDGHASAFVDVDDFKAIKDTFGQDMSDQLLLRLAAWLRQLCDRRGRIAAWLGGDEIAVPSPAISIAHAVAAAHEPTTGPENRSRCSVRVFCRGRPWVWRSLQPARRPVRCVTARIWRCAGKAPRRRDCGIQPRCAVSALTRRTRSGGWSRGGSAPAPGKRPRAAFGLPTRPERPARARLGHSLGERRPVRLWRAAVASQGIRLSKVELQETAVRRHSETKGER